MLLGFPTCNNYFLSFITNPEEMNKVADALAEYIHYSLLFTLQFLVLHLLQIFAPQTPSLVRFGLKFKPITGPIMWSPICSCFGATNCVFQMGVGVCVSSNICIRKDIWSHSVLLSWSSNLITGHPFIEMWLDLLSVVWHARILRDMRQMVDFICPYPSPHNHGHILAWILCSGFLVLNVVSIQSLWRSIVFNRRRWVLRQQGIESG